MEHVQTRRNAIVFDRIVGLGELSSSSTRSRPGAITLGNVAFGNNAVASSWPGADPAIHEFINEALDGC
jgi:hypothetical protein